METGKVVMTVKRFAMMLATRARLRVGMVRQAQRHLRVAGQSPDVHRRRAEREGCLPLFRLDRDGIVHAVEHRDGASLE